MRRFRPLLLGVLVSALVTLTLFAAAQMIHPGARARAPESDELVVLVHGLGRSPLSMMHLERALEHEGYSVLNWGYSSTCCTVAQIGEQLSTDLARHGTEQYDRVHFVGHSLGTVIIRWVLSNDPPARTGRVVMLAPPNQGSRAADVTADELGGILKPLPELQTEPTSTARTLTLPRNVEVGVIAGRFDGKVTVAETRLDGADHRIVPAAHTFIMIRPDVRDLTIRFLRTGRFTEAVS